MFTQWGLHGRALYGSTSQHQSTKHQAATSYQDQPLFRLIIREALHLWPNPLPLYPTSWWPTRLGRLQLKCLGQHNQGPTITRSRTNTKQFDPVCRGAVEAKCKKKATKEKALESERSVLEHVIELIEINIHDWTHKLGHLAAHLMPTSVTIRCCPAGREGSLLRSGMGRMPVTVLKKRDHRGATVTSPLLCAPMSALLRKDIIYIWIRGSSGPAARVEAGLSVEHSHLPAGCFGPVLMVAALQSHASPPIHPLQLYASPRRHTLMPH